VRLSCLARNGLLAQGKKVDPTTLRLRRSRRSRSSARSGHQEARCVRALKQHRQEKTWRTPVLPHKTSASSGAEIEAIAEKRRRRSSGHGHDRTPGHKFVGCRTFGVLAFRRSEEDRVASRASASGRDPSTPDSPRTLIAEAKALLLACRCRESWLRLIPRRPARPQWERLRQGGHPRPGRAADKDRAVVPPVVAAMRAVTPRVPPAATSTHATRQHREACRPPLRTHTSTANSSNAACDHGLGGAACFKASQAA
jgi:hypothetical protein